MHAYRTLATLRFMGLVCGQLKQRREDHYRLIYCDKFSFSRLYWPFLDFKHLICLDDKFVSNLMRVIVKMSYRRKIK